MWVLTSQGIYVVKASEMLADNISDYRLYTLANGLTSLPVSHSYSHLDEEGNLYMAGQSGVCKFNIYHFYEEIVKVKTGVKTVYCDDVELKPDDKGEYVIPADCERIQITPTVFDYTLSNPTVHVFLEGANDDGITVEQNKITPLEYTELGYGNYVLHIQIMDRSTGKMISDESLCGVS